MKGLSQNILNSLIEKLLSNGTIQQVVQDFEILTDTNSQKIEFAENLLKLHDLLPSYDKFEPRKCYILAEEFKNLGNQLYRDKKFYEALVSYNKSLCYSPKDSQNVGITFANRSAVYFSMGQYEKCIENIELAKNHNYPKDKIEKLKNREEQAVENLNNSPDPNQKLIKYEAARERFLKPKLKAKENLNFFVADCLEVKTSPEFGRHLITNEDLKVGSVIAVEKPFAKTLVSEAIHERCANCLKKNLLNLFPCFNCCSAMFCSKDCRSAAQEKFHKFECGLLTTIDVLFSETCSLPLRIFFEALHICGTPSKLREFLNSIKDSKDTILDFNYTDEASFRKNSLNAIDTLRTFEKSPKCTIFDLFICSNACAIVCNLMLNHSKALKDVLVDVADQDFFKEFFFKYSQIANMNFHGLVKFCMTVDVPDQVQFGAGSFSFCSLFNHSCAPNVGRIVYGTTNYVIVTRPIKKGHQIFDNYRLHHCSDSFEERQNQLFQQYRFECQCEACTNNNNYPMSPDLKVKDEYLLETLLANHDKLLKENLEMAVDSYEEYCKYIDEFDAKLYPSHESSLLHDMMLCCLTIILKNESYEV